MSKTILVLEATCPNCDDLLTEGDKVRLVGCRRATGMEGEVRLSAVFGDPAVDSDFEIPQGDVVEFRCPTCDQVLSLNVPCRLCGAPMASLNVRGGGVLDFCTRRGCRAHALGGFGDLDQLIGLINRITTAPHE